MPTTKAKPEAKTAPEPIASAAQAILDAFSLIDAIEQRMVDIERDPIPASWPERQAILSALPELSEPVEFRRAIQHARAARTQRQAGVSRQAVADAEAELAKAVEAEQTTAATIGDLDVTEDPSPALVRQIKTLEKRFAKLRAAREQAEANFHNQRAALESQIQRVPKPLRDRVATQRARLVREAGIDQLRAAQRDLATAEEVIRRVEATKGWGSEARIGRWWPYLEAKCPAAIKKDGQRRQIDPPTIEAHAAQLREKLADLRAGVDQLEAKIRTAVSGCDEIVYSWAETGSAPANQLTQLMG